MLALIKLGEDAYGVTVAQEIEASSGRTVAIGSLYLTLKRLEQKKLVIVATRRADSGARRPGQDPFLGHGKGVKAAAHAQTDLDHAVERRSPTSGRRRMNKRAPAVATWLLVRFSSGPHGEAIAGDLMEQYAAHPSRWWYWRRSSPPFAPTSSPPSGTTNGERRRPSPWAGSHIWHVVPSDVAGPQVEIDHAGWLSDIDPEWFLWTLRAESTLIIAIVCVAIGWGVAKVSRRSAPGAVCLLAMTMLIFEYGMIALFFADWPGTGTSALDRRTRRRGSVCVVATSRHPAGRPLRHAAGDSSRLAS